MARAVNVLLDIQGKQFDINKMGLTSLTFDRFLGSTRNISSSVLSNLDMTVFDKTGSEILALLQQNQNRILLKYGFEGDDFSQTYLLNVIKFKATYNNLGIMVGIGAIGTQLNRKFKAEVYKKGTLISDILKVMARRNGWYIGQNENDKEYVSVKSELSTEIYKPSNKTDMEFITEVLLPMAGKSAFDPSSAISGDLFDVRLTFQNNRLEFYFRELSGFQTTRRVWTYEYGASTKNNIISMTNSVDFSFLVKGLSLQIPVTSENLILKTEEQNRLEVTEVIDSSIAKIEQIVNDYGVPFFDPNNFLYNIELVPSEETGPLVVEQIILDKLKQIMNTINTIEITVIGNPRIMPTDLIEINVKNKDGSPNIFSSYMATGSYWRVITIREEIGLQGYSTRMQLVREIVNN